MEVWHVRFQYRTFIKQSFSKNSPSSVQLEVFYWNFLKDFKAELPFLGEMDPGKGEKRMKKKSKVKVLVSIAMLSSISYILMLLNFPIPPFPSFLMIDFSDLPALIGALIFGPAAGILVELFKNILDYFMTGSDTGIPIGHMANFVAGIVFILPSYYIYSKLKTKKGMTFALVVGSISMAVIMSVLNYFVLLPAYSFFLNWPAMSGAEMRQYIVTGILPFNIIKGFIMSLVFMLLFIKLRPWLIKKAALQMEEPGYTTVSK